MNTVAFDHARDAFLASLSEKDRKLYSPCASSSELLAGIGKLEAITKQKTRGRKHLQAIREFSDNLAPYFRLVDIFVSSNPQYAALCWGAVRLVLQV